VLFSYVIYLNNSKVLLQLTRGARLALVIVVDHFGLAHDLRLNGALDAVGGDVGLALLLEADVGAAVAAVEPAVVAVAGPRGDPGRHLVAGAGPAVPVVGVGLVVRARLVRVRGAHHAGDHVGNVHLNVQLDQVNERVELDVDDAVGKRHDADKDNLYHEL
jgi:hypothetical protein